MNVSKGLVIERVARVLAGQRISANGEGGSCSAGDEVDVAWRDHVDDAIAVLKTLREPDAAMARAGDAAVRGGVGGSGPVCFLRHRGVHGSPGEPVRLSAGHHPAGNDDPRPEHGFVQLLLHEALKSWRLEHVEQRCRLEWHSTPTTFDIHIPMIKRAEFIGLSVSFFENQFLS